MVQQTLDSELQLFFHYFSRFFKDEKPLMKLFRTESSYYLYDTGTNKIVQCEEMEYDILEQLYLKSTNLAFKDISEKYKNNKLINTLQSIKTIIDQENILQAIKPTKFYSPRHYENLEHIVNNKISLITLEVTERCNLRCEYCIYNPHVSDVRNFGNLDMTQEIAFAAIDYAAKHSSQANRLSVTFYGGEPLLKWDLIQSCIKYSQENIDNDKLHFSISTNGTLITPAIAQYLAFIKNMSLLCSIDGPKDIHDRYRKDKKGNGSYERSIRGLKNLFNAFGESNWDRIILNIVYTPPFHKRKIEKIMTLFDELPWLPKNTTVQFNYPHEGSIPPEKFQRISTLAKLCATLFNVSNSNGSGDLANWAKQQLINSSSNIKEEYQKSAYRISGRDLNRIHKRPIFNKPSDKYQFNACCVPAERRLYITAKGDFLICERASGTPSLGNVFTGIDINKIRKYFIEDYVQNSLEHCSKCWAIRFCDVCYASCYEKGKFSIERKLGKCCDTYEKVEHNLITYFQCFEKNPDSLKKLGDILFA